MFLVGEVESRQDGLELVQNLVVSRHVGGQDASAVRTQSEPGSAIRITLSS